MAVYDLKIPWEREKAAPKMVITEDEAWVKVAVDVPVPTSLLWDYLATPALKIQMTGLVTMDRVDDLDGRTGEGTVYHCAHGSGMVVDYEIVAWRPFQYFTFLLTDTMAKMQYYETYHFIPTEKRTHFLSLASKSKGEATAEMQAMVQALWEEGYGGIRLFIEGEIARGKISEMP